MHKVRRFSDLWLDFFARYLATEQGSAVYSALVVCHTQTTAHWDVEDANHAVRSGIVFG